jgi:6-phosphogluconolactonase
MTADFRIYPDVTALARAAATQVVDIAQSAIALNGRFSVALSGGTTPERMYRLLATPEFSSRIDWKHVHLFWSDERCVAPDHPDSNYAMAWMAFIDHVPISMDNIHRILGEEDPVVAADTYEQELKDHFKSAVPRFDLMLLGLGEDGHTASIFPGSTAAIEGHKLAVATQHPNSNQWRVTLTFPAINASANVSVLVSGSTKASMVRIVKSGLVSPENVPATGIEPDGGTVTWFCDHAAAGGS